MEDSSNSLNESSHNDFDDFIRSFKKKKPISAGSSNPSNSSPPPGETELYPPPSLKPAFARNHQARRGLELMLH